MLKAIDMQQIVMQIEQAEKVQRMEQNRPDMQQRYLELHIKEEKKLRQNKVTDAEEAGKTLIRDGKEQEKSKERRDGAGRRENCRQIIGEDADQDEGQEGGHININV